MTILAVDLGLEKTGIAWEEHGGGGVTTLISRRTGTGKKRQSTAVRLEALRHAFCCAIIAARPTLVAYEAPLRRNWLSYRSECHVEAVLLCACAEFGVPTLGYAGSHVKLMAAGKGNASKAAVAEKVRERLGLPLGLEEDEYDAAAVLVCARRHVEEGK